jgi:hypothetical protein
MIASEEEPIFFTAKLNGANFQLYSLHMQAECRATRIAQNAPYKVWDLKV